MESKKKSFKKDKLINWCPSLPCSQRDGRWVCDSRVEMWCVFWQQTEEWGFEKDIRSKLVTASPRQLLRLGHQLPVGGALTRVQEKTSWLQWTGRWSPRFQSTSNMKLLRDLKGKELNKCEPQFFFTFYFGNFQTHQRQKYITSLYSQNFQPMVNPDLPSFHSLCTPAASFGS